MSHSTHSTLALETDNALCSECLAPVPYKIIFRGSNVLMKKTCYVHGVEEVMISSDKNYWIAATTARERKSATEVSDQIKPYMIIVEAIDECDIACPTCIASSIPGSGNIRKRSDLASRVGTLAGRYGKIPLLMISGGEPTLHPEILGILRDLQQFADQVMLITNGIRIAQDEAFVEDLASLGEGFQVYLQFDSLQPSALIALRGKDFRAIRLQALANLEKFHVATTLISVVKRGINDTEVAEIACVASKHRNVRGVTFQPIRSTGRHIDFRYADHSVTLSEVRTTLLRELNFPENAMIPHPLNPESICIGYFDKASGSIVPVTNEVFSPISPISSIASKQLYLDRRSVMAMSENYELMRITIISFLDGHDYTVAASRQGGIYFLTDDETLVTLESRFLFGLRTKGIPSSTPTSQETSNEH